MNRDGSHVIRKPSEIKSMKISDNHAVIEFNDSIINYHILTGKPLAEHNSVIEPDAKLIYFPTKNLYLNLSKDK